MRGFQQKQLELYLDNILDALVRQDKAALKRFGQQNGFVNDRIRRLVWPVLLDCLDDDCSLYKDEQFEFPDVDERDIITIQQDVRRSFTRFPDLEDSKRIELENRLEALITKILRIHPRLHYVQGFHDVAEVLILVIDDPKSFLPYALLHHLSLFNFRDMLLPSLEPMLNSLNLIPAILQRIDSKLYKRVLIAIRPPHFAASSLMTWFAHDLSSLNILSSLYDFLLSSPPITIFYLITAVILHSKPEIVAKPDDDEKADEFAVVYSRLVKVLRGDRVNVGVVLGLTRELVRRVPPETLDIYGELSEWSCYKLEGVESERSWMEEGSRILKEATEEQYRSRTTETPTEVARRERTIIRQDQVDEILKEYKVAHVEVSQEQMREKIKGLKELVIAEEVENWKVREEQRKLEEQQEKERRRLAKDLYRKKRSEDKEWDNNFWGIVIGGTAIAIVVIAIMKGYHYV